MAIKIYEQFAPFANPADGDYPLGSFKNDSIPGAEDGTPLDAIWANDYAGFDAALLAEAGTIPSGSADTALVSQRLDAMKTILLQRVDIQPPVLDERDVRFQITDNKSAIRYGLNEAVPKDDQFNFFRGLNSPDSWGDPLNLGVGSASFGRNGASYAYLSTTFGHDCSAYGVASTVGGAGSTTGNPDDPNAAFGYCAFAHGKNTQAKGRTSHSVGEECVAGSDYSEATGYQSIAGPADIAHPNYVASTGLYAMAKGFRTKAYGDYAIAIGASISAYNGAQVYGTGINTGSLLVNSTPNSMAFGRSVDIATIKVCPPAVIANGAYGRVGFNTNDAPLDLVETHVKGGDTVSHILDATNATPFTFRLGARVGGANRGIFDIKYNHPNAGQPFGVTTLWQNESQFMIVTEYGDVTFNKLINAAFGYNVGGVRVVSSRQAAIPNANGTNNTAVLNEILAALRAHGLIDT